LRMKILAKSKKEKRSVKSMHFFFHSLIADENIG